CRIGPRVRRPPLRRSGAPRRRLVDQRRDARSGVRVERERRGHRAHRARARQGPTGRARGPHRARDLDRGGVRPVDGDQAAVRDVVDAYARLLVKGLPGEMYNVASGQAVSLDELFDRVATMVGIRPIPEADPDLMRAGDVLHLVGDASKLRAATGWAPRYDLN